MPRLRQTRPSPSFLPMLATTLLFVTMVGSLIVAGGHHQVRAQGAASPTHEVTRTKTPDFPPCCCVPRVAQGGLFDSYSVADGSSAPKATTYFPVRRATLEIEGLREGEDEIGPYVELPTRDAVIRLQAVETDLRVTGDPIELSSSLTEAPATCDAALIASGGNRSSRSGGSSAPAPVSSLLLLDDYCRSFSSVGVKWATAASRMADASGAPESFPGPVPASDRASFRVWWSLLTDAPRFTVSVRALEGYVPQSNDKKPALSATVALNIDAVQRDFSRYIRDVPAQVGVSYSTWNASFHGAPPPGATPTFGATSVAFTPGAMLLPCDELHRAYLNGSVTDSGRVTQQNTDASTRYVTDMCNPLPGESSAEMQAMERSGQLPPAFTRENLYNRDIVARLRHNAEVTVCVPTSAFAWESSLSATGTDDAAQASCLRRSITEDLAVPMYPQSTVDSLVLCASREINVPKRDSVTMQATGIVAIVVTSLSVITAPPSGVGALATLDAQTFTIIGLMSCSSEAEKRIVQGLRFFVSPVIDLSNFSLVLLINAQIAIFAVLGHFFLVVVNYRQRTEKKTLKYKQRLRRSAARRRRRRQRRQELAARGGGGSMGASGRDDMTDAGDDGASDAPSRMGQSVAMSASSFASGDYDGMEDLEAIIGGHTGGGGAGGTPPAMEMSGTFGRRGRASQALGGGGGGGLFADHSDSDDAEEAEQVMEHKLLDEVRRFSMRRFTAVAARARFPSMSFLVAILMFQGILFASVHLSTFSRDSAYATVGVLGVLLAVAFVVLSTVLVQQQRLRFFPYYDLHPWLRQQRGGAGTGDATDVNTTVQALTKRGDRDNAEKLRALRPLKAKWWLTWLYPLGTWGPSRQRLMYSKLFSAYTGTAKTWFVFPLLLAIAVNIITVIHPDTLRGCFVQLSCLGAMFLFAAVVIIIRQPMRVIYKNVLSFLAYLTFAAHAAARGTQLYMMRERYESDLGSASDADGKVVTAINIGVWCGMAQVLLIGVRATLDGVFTYLEGAKWRPRNFVYQKSLAEEGHEEKRAIREDLDKKRERMERAEAVSVFDGRSSVGAWRASERGHSDMESSLSGDERSADMALELGRRPGNLTADDLDGLGRAPGTGERRARRPSMMRGGRNLGSATAEEMRRRSNRVGRVQASAEDHEANIEWLLGGQRKPVAAPKPAAKPAAATSKPKRRVGVKFDV